MSLDDIIGGNDGTGPDFTADSVLDRVSRGVLSDIPDNANADMVLNRLNRKLSEPKKAAETETKPKKIAGGPDFSDQGTPIGDLPDFSDQGTPIAQAQPTSPGGVSLGVTGQAKAALKGIAGAPLEMAGGALKGAGTMLARGVGTQAPEGNEFAANPLPTDAGGRITTPEKAIAASPLIPAGQTIKDLAPNMSDAERRSIGGRIGSGVGQIGTFAATTLLAGPLAGFGAAAVTTGLDAYGSTYEAARKAGKTDDQANEYGMKAAATAATLSTVGLGAGRFANTLIRRVALSAGSFATAGEVQDAILEQIAKNYDPKAGYSPDAERIITNLVLGGALGGFHHWMAGRNPAEAPPAPAPGTPPGAAPAGAIPAPGPGTPPPGAAAGGRARSWTGNTHFDSSTGEHFRENSEGMWFRYDPGKPNEGFGTDGNNGPGPKPDNSGSGGRAKPGEQPKTKAEAEAEANGPIPPAPGTGKGPDFQFESATKRQAMQGVVQTMSDRNKWGLDVKNMTDAELWNAVVSNEQNSTNAQSSKAKPETPEEVKQREDTARDREIQDELIRAGIPEANVKYMTPEQRSARYDEVMKFRAEAKAKAQGAKPESAPKSERQSNESGSRTKTAEAERPPEMEIPGEAPNNGSVEPSGRREAPIKPQTADDVLKAQPVEPKSQAQAEAENFPHAHVDLEQFGLVGRHNISVETGVGQTRKGVGPDGEPWEVKLEHSAYGRIKGTVGADGQPLDIHVGPHPASPYVFVIDQHDPSTGKFDEHKIMAGYRTPIDALHAYAHSYNDAGKDRIGWVTAMGPTEFKAWLKTDTTKPLRPASPARKTEEAGSTEAVPSPAPKGSPPDTGTESSGPGLSIPKPEKSSARKPTHQQKYIRDRVMNDEREPLTLLQFIASKGGIEPGPELDALDLNGKKRAQIPGRKGFFAVVRPGGQKHDVMRRMAQEEGYFPKETEGKAPVHTLADFYEALDEEHNRGRSQRAEGEELDRSKRERELGAERSAHEQERDETHFGDARKALADAGYGDISTDVRELAARRMLDLGESADDAVERAALQLADQEDFSTVTQPEFDDIFGAGASDEIRAEAVSRDGGPAASEGTQESAPDQGEEDRGAGEHVPAARKESGKGKKPEHHDTGGKNADTGRDTADQGAAAKAEHQPAAKAANKSEAADDVGVDTHEAFADTWNTYKQTVDRIGVDVIVKNGYALEQEARKAIMEGEDPETAIRRVFEGAEPLRKKTKAQTTIERGRAAADKTGVEVFSKKFGKRSFLNLSIVPDAGEWSWSADYEIGGFSGGSAAGATHATREEALQEAVAKLTKQVSVSGGATNETHHKTSAEMKNWLADMRPESAAPATEKGADNKPQLVMPGAEKAPDKTMAQRAANAPLKPRVAQKAADVGLFGDEKDQTDLLDLAKAPSLPPAPPKDIFDDIFDKAIDEQFGAKPAVSLDDVAAGLKGLFGKGLSEGEPAFADDTYAKALPFFKAGVAHFNTKGTDLPTMIRSLVKHLASAGMDQAAIQSMKPYIRRFTEDVAAGRETLNAPSSGDVLEPSGGKPAVSDTVGKSDVPAAAGPTGPGAPEGGETAGERGSRPRARKRVSQDHAPAVGAEGNLELPAREPDVASGDAAAGERERGAVDGEEGLPFDRTSDEETIHHAQAEADVGARRDRQRKAEGTKVIPGDIGNIAETLPMLFPEQHDDVLKAEQRFAKPDGHGMLFTNGTGTGKTYSGLGVIKRLAMQGKTDTLVVAPSQGILMDWVKSARDLGLDLKVLADTQDKGKGFVGTTYANLGANRTLADRNWDLIVTDEAHKLSSDKDGTTTEALKTLRAITKHPDGLLDRARMVLRDEWDAIGRLPKDKQGDAHIEWQRKANPLILKWREEDRPKTLMMSATPFAYHFSLDYANGYLFEYDKDRSGARYNSGDGRDAFFMQHLGYRMRINKLTKPEADVRAEVMERQLHEHLKKTGSLSGRALAVDKDYDRRFVLAHDAVGELIDRALTFLTDAEDGKYLPLYDIISKRFDYLTRMRLLEAMKAQTAIPFIKKSLALGRKIVVFHDYNEGGGISPFILHIPPDEKTTVYQGGKHVEVHPAELYDEFVRQNPYVEHLDFSKYPPPIRALTAAFPNALVYNGTVSNKERNQSKALFNADDSGRDIIIVQSAAGEAGISLHDTTGKRQRVLLNLGMPIRPTTSIQQEGRIYRVGQASDAIFRYMNTGTDWERWTFAGKIAERAGTAENLALGDQARTIRQSFVDAFSNSGDYEPEPGEGKGGKELDRATTHSVSEFEKAKTHYFAQAKVRGRRDQREGTDYYATPEPIGLKMVEFAGLKPGEKILEPSAGHGAISRYFPEDSMRTLVEPSTSLASRAALTSPGARVVVDRFENLPVGANKFDAIVMNPPFGHGGSTAIEHLRKAISHLKNGGRIVALIPQGPAADKKFDDLMASTPAAAIHIVGDIKLPPVTFDRAGTAINARIVVLEKQTDVETASKLQQKSRDYSDAETISQLFDRIENADMGERLEPLTKDVEAPSEGKVTVAGIDFHLRNEVGSYSADVETFLGDRFRKVTRLAEDHGGHYNKSSKSLKFPSIEARQAFLTALAAPEPERPSAPSGVSFRSAETVHGKTGAPLFVASPDQRVERDVYNQMAQTAKANGGWYSAFKGQGAIPGFQFKSKEAWQAFLDAMGGKGGLGESGPLTARETRELDDLEARRDDLDRYEQDRLDELDRRADLPAPATSFNPKGRGAEGQNYTLAEGRATGVEYLVAYDATGNEVERGSGTENNVKFSAAFLELLHKPDADIVVHHNHPTSKSLSAQDVGMMVLPGLRAVWAHGHNGTIYRGELTPAYRDTVKGNPTAQYWRMMRLVNLAEDRIKRLIEIAVTAKEVTLDEANGAFNHLANVILRDAGILDYQTNFDLGDFLDRVPGLDNAIQSATISARLEAFGGTADNQRDHRRAGAVRHAGDVGAVFDRASLAATVNGKDRIAPARAEDHRGKAKAEGVGGEQLRLLEPAGLESPFDIFRKKQNTTVKTRIADLMESTKWNKFVERYQNLSEPVKRLQEALEARSNGTLPDTEAFYIKKRLFPGKIGNESKEFERRYLDPLIKLLKDSGLALEDIGDLLYARHAPERNAEIDKINPALGGAGSGMSDTDAAAIRARYVARQPLVREIARQIGNIREYILHTMEFHGLESPETLNAWRAKYKNYVPLGGFEDAARQEENSSLGEPGKFNVRGREVKQALGRTSKANNPLVNLLDQAYRTMERAKKNEYLQALDRALSGAAPADMTGLAKRNPSTPRRVISKTTGLVHTIDTGVFAMDPAAVAFKIKGETHYWVFKDRQLAEAIKRMHPDGIGMWQGLLDLQNHIKAMWTHYSPDFLLRHFLFRYPVEGTLNSFEMKEDGKFAVSQYIKDAAPFIGNASRAIFATNKGLPHSDPEIRAMQRYWEEMRSGGGAMVFRQMRDTDLTREHLKMKLSSLRKSTFATINEKRRGFIEAMDTVTNALDNALRLAAYVGARKQGKSIDQAALIARDATVDFQQYGKWKNGIGLIFPFGNVAIQTGARMVSRLPRSRIMRRVFMATMAAGFLSTSFNYVVGGKDTDGRYFMDKIPEWERRLNFTVLNPFHLDDKGRPVPIHIPMPYNWAFPMTIGSATASVVFSTDKHSIRNMLGMVTKSGVEVATPFGQEENYAAILTPEIVRPFVHIATNENYNGLPVHMNPTFQKGPASESGRKTTGEGWKFIASGVNTLTGGNKHHQGVLDFYPEDYRLLFDYVGGSQRRFVENLLNTGAKVGGEKSTDWAHVPLARVFMGTNYDAANRAHRHETKDKSEHPWKR